MTGRPFISEHHAADAGYGEVWTKKIQRIGRAVRALFASGSKRRTEGGAGLAGVPVPTRPLPWHGGTEARFPNVVEDDEEWRLAGSEMKSDERP